MLDIDFLVDVFIRLSTGIPMTLKLASVSLFFGLILAIGLALLREFITWRIVQFLAGGFVEFMRGTPLLVQIFIIYYGLSQFAELFISLRMWWFFKEPYWCSILALTLNTAAYSSEIIRGGLQAVPKGQVEAAKAVGMSPILAFRRIVFPLAARYALPAYSNEIILIVKATSLASIITLVEVTKIAHEIIFQTYRATEVFVCAGLIYLTISFVIARLVAKLEYGLSSHLRPSPINQIRK